MKLKVIETEFSNREDWVFKLINEANEVFYILNSAGYKEHQLKSPVTRPLLDCLFTGHTLDGIVKEIEGKNIVVSVEKVDWLFNENL